MVCFGEKYSDSFYRGRFTADGHSNAGAWQWPDGDGGTGGYASTMTRLED